MLVHGSINARVGYDDAAMDDAQLVKAACEGDRDAFADIYDRYSGRIYAFLCSTMRDRDDASDALQDTFLAAGSRIGQLRDPSKLRPWLFAIARHNAMHRFSRIAKQEPFEDLEVTDPGPEPAEIAASSELADLIREAAGGLGDQDRIVLGLHLEQGLQGQELGDAIGVSAGHAYVLMNRMRQQVERSIGALLVARHGRRECDKLNGLLELWDGRFSVVWRKRVARHVDGCEICAELRKRLVSPVSMMAVPPIIPAPAAAREFVLENLRLVGARAPLDNGVDAVGKSTADLAASGEKPWPRRYGGFPPPMARPARRRMATVLGAALLLMLFAGPGAGSFEGGPLPVRVAPLEFPVVQEPSSPPVPTEQDTPALPEQPLVVPAPVRSSAATGPPAPRLASPGSSAHPADGPSPDGADVEPSPTGGDQQGPDLNVRVQPARIYATACAREADPTRAQVSATATDGSGVDSVVLKYREGSKSMSAAGGGSYTAAVGPFAGESTVPFTVIATDRLGNSATRSGSIRVECEASPPSRPAPELRVPDARVPPSGVAEERVPDSGFVR